MGLLRTSHVSLATLVAAFLAAPAVLAQDAPSGPPPATQYWSDTDVQITPNVTLENHGYFRFRFNELYRLTLGSGGASGFPSTLESTSVNSTLNRSGDNLQSADMRFRYDPRLRVGDWLTIGVQLDILDNLVMGSSPVTGEVGTPVGFFARTQQSPDDLVAAIDGALRVKAVWGDIRVFGKIHVFGGRMPEKFGLGVLRSDGNGIDSDFGDYVDQIGGKVKLGSVWIKIAMEFPAEGASSESPSRYFGPVHDAEQFDDINRWVFVFDSSPVEKEDFEALRKTLDEDRKVALDWGMYHAITQQELATDRIGGTLPAFCDVTSQFPFGRPYDCYSITPRGSFFWTPALWGRLLYHPTPDLSIRLEAEWDMVYGHIDYTQSFLDSTKDKTKKTFLEFGAALNAEVGWRENLFGFLFGLASGDASSGRFGVLDGQTVAAVDDSRYTLDPAVANHSSVRNFTFNRDFRVDSILFREVIGAVTNAFFFKPSYHRWLLQSGDHKLGAGASVMAAFAMEPDGTPGRSRGLGVEVGLKLDYHLSTALTVAVDGAMLFPLAGLKAVGATEDPRSAVAIRTFMAVKF